MLIAVTGAAGFLGVHTVAAMKRHGHRVRALIRGASESSRIRPYVTEWQQGELSDRRVQSELVKGAQAVAHLAMDWESLQEGALANVAGNLLPTLQLLEASHQAGSQFLFVSSMDVYAGCATESALTEAHAACPNSHYSAFKSAVEQCLLAYHGAEGMNTSGWRPATMYGVHHELARTPWMPLIEHPEREPDDPGAHAGAHVVAVEDVAEALALAVGDPMVSGQIYNLVDSYVRLRQISAWAAEARGRGRPHVPAPPRPEQLFDNRKAVTFFERHGQPMRLRRGLQGVGEHVARVVAALETSQEPSD